jgi:hypothetical protein
MTSLRQVESNRRNAQKSTGPKTENGKQRASQNAVRHGLTAETVITLLEDTDDYQAFELAVTADYEAETAVERELVLRLASLLWRLRRATSIETRLFQIQNEIVRTPASSKQIQPRPKDRAVKALCRHREPASDVLTGDDTWSNGCYNRDAGQNAACADSEPSLGSRVTVVRLDAAQRFLHLTNLENNVFERLGRYEAALWRQVRQTLFTLERLRWQAPSNRNWRTRDRWQRTIRSPSPPAPPYRP